MTAMNSGIKIKIFMGCRLDSRLKLQLSQSMAWKNARIEGQANQTAWVETRHEGHDYIGHYLESAPVKFDDIKKHQALFLSNLQNYSSDIDIKKINLILFPKLFVN